MRKSTLFGIALAIGLVVGLGGIFSLILLRPRGSEQPSRKDLRSNLKPPGTATQQVAQDRDPCTDTPVPWRDNGRSTVRLIAEEKARERAGDYGHKEGHGRHVIYPKGYVKWHDGGVKWKGDEDAVEPDETDSTDGTPDSASGSPTRGTTTSEDQRSFAPLYASCNA